MKVPWRTFAAGRPCYAEEVKEFFNDWWRLLKLIVLSLAVPVVLYLLLLWVGILK
ncbi:cation transport ATPase [Deinococcus maricopensis DSM 21211]|uniref:Cation transport ATPase n=1 Tax=Deinococcus maricopensis (strain DSM 21211 / LMG 22137 / NRRL B-23946 / LB-34) TaxID=709986 RepID=E8U7K4_DEIML|nr:cation transport ATPase [Deinococcus maricopensis DSM 21211]